VKELSAGQLKAELWDTLLKLKAKKIAPIVANAVAKQSREIMNVVRAEMAIAASNNQKFSQNILSTNKK
jgi:hypothetical protein